MASEQAKKIIERLRNEALFWEAKKLDRKDVNWRLLSPVYEDRCTIYFDAIRIVKEVMSDECEHHGSIIYHPHKKGNAKCVKCGRELEAKEVTGYDE